MNNPERRTMMILLALLLVDELLLTYGIHRRGINPNRERRDNKNFMN